MAMTCDPCLTGDDRLDDGPPQGLCDIELALMTQADDAVVRAYREIRPYFDNPRTLRAREWRVPGNGFGPIERARDALNEALDFCRQAEAVAEANRKRWC